MSSEPSMEDILASIRRIIAEEGEAAVAVPLPRSRPMRAKPADAAPVESFTPMKVEEVLELTQPLAPPESLLSDGAAKASRMSLAALSALAVKPPEGSDGTLEGLVREMLKPMLAEWLDAHLPDLVERMVASEIARITGKRT